MKKKYNYLIVIFLIIASCVAFGGIAGNDFVNYDDQAYITDNLNIKSGFNYESIKWAFLKSASFYYWHPITWLSHMLDWSLFGANASGHHIVSLLLHIGSILFLFLFLNKTTNNIWASAFAAAFFALHPLRVESVAWAAERKDVLSMFFGITCLYVYAFYAENYRLSKYLLCLILFALALMSKPMMVTLPFILMLLDYWPLKRWQKSLSAPTQNRLKLEGRLAWEKVPFILLTVISSILTFWAQKKGGSVASEEILPFAIRISNAIVSCINYLGEIFCPINLAAYYPYDFSLPLWKILISGFILTLITVVVLYYIKQLPFLFTGWCWYLGTVIPGIGFVQVGTQAMADRHTYLPSIGIAIMLAWGLSSLFKSKNILKNILFSAEITIIILLAVLTWLQCHYWKNSFTLFNHALRVTNNNYIAHNRIAFYLAEKKKFNLSIYHYNKSIDIKPQPLLSYAENYFARGLSYAGLSMHKKAIEDYNKAINLKPDFAEAYYTRGTVYGKFMGQYQLAINDFSQAISLKPDYIDAYNNRGIILNALGLYQKAVDDFSEAIRLRPNHANAWNNRAFSYLNLGDIEQGCLDAKKSCHLGNCKTLEWATSKKLCD